MNLRISKVNLIKFLELILLLKFSYAWLPDQRTRIINEIGQVNTTKFIGNASYTDHFRLLKVYGDTLILGGRNTVYNLSLINFYERKEYRFEWPSSEYHSQLCSVKGKTEDDCQNYIRIFVNIEPSLFLICGTNSYKPLCRHYEYLNGVYNLKREFEGIGICPYDPEYNSTSIYYNDQLYTATAADFSGGDPLIYREPQRTEISDLKQLNGEFHKIMVTTFFLLFYF